MCWRVGKHEGKLIVTKSEDISCDHKQGFFTKDKECKKEDYKCREVMECCLCKEHFKISDEFLKEQKMKIKDG
jgi:hypothetical protein